MAEDDKISPRAKALYQQLLTIKKASKSRAKHVVPEQIDVGGSKRGLTLSTLLRMTANGPFRSRFDNVTKYGVTVVKCSQPVGEGRVMRYTTSEGRKGFTESLFHHQVIVRLEPDKKFFQSRVALRCSCSDFKFRAEYALAKRGCALLPNASNLEPPGETNKTEAVFACKHLLAVANHIFKKAL